MLHETAFEQDALITREIAINDALENILFLVSQPTYALTTQNCKTKKRTHYCFVQK